MFTDESSVDNQPFRTLASSEDWTAALDASEDGPVVVFKHSSVCPTSARANGEMSELAESLPEDVPVYRVIVQESRDVSDAIAEELGIRHESPQVIVLKDRTPVFDTSHHRVKADRVKDALDSN
jgi:bacillithiol system protein YtxJ